MSISADCPLTRAEYRVLRLVAEGMTYQQIARRLGRSVSTVRSQGHTAVRRLGVRNRVEAVLFCHDRGWLPSPETKPGFAQLERIEGLLTDIKDALKGKSGRLTPAQQALLRAFDHHLAARGDGELAETELMQARAAAVVLREAGVPDRPRSRPDLIRLLASEPWT